MQNKLMILSIDALETDDIPYLRTLPNFSRVLDKAAIVRNVREVYPTLTNVSHVSIITGVAAESHGVFHNMIPFVPAGELGWNVIGENWFWRSDYIKAPTIIDAAKSKGLTTACVTWPSMGGTVPDVNLAEIWPQTRPTVRETYEASCTKNVMELYFDQYIAPFNFKESFDTDAFTVPIAADILRRFQPDLMLEHIIFLDYCRHKAGNNSQKVREALTRIDGFFGSLLEALREAGTADITNVVILGDHGQMDIRETFQLNVLLKECGLVSVDETGTVQDWEAYSFSAGFSTQIILKNPADPEKRAKVHRTLEKIQKAYPRQIERIYTAEEAQREESLAGAFSFVIEAAEGVCFENSFTGPVLLAANDSLYKGYKSNHGYHPSKGPKPPFIAFGPDIIEGAMIEGASILDECPTFAKLLGVEMPGLKGKILDIVR